MADYLTRPVRQQETRSALQRRVTGLFASPSSHAAFQSRQLRDCRPLSPLYRHQWHQTPAVPVQATSVVQRVVNVTFDQHRGDSPADQATVDGYAALVAAEHMIAADTYKATAMTGAAPYVTMMARRLTHLVAYGMARNTARNQQPVDWGAVGATLDAWAVAVNAALIGAQEHAAAHGGYRDLLTTSATLLKTLEEEKLTDREMYKNLAVARKGYHEVCETARADHMWDQTAEPFHLLKQAVDIVEQRTKGDSPDWANEYGNQRDDSWGGAKAALTSLNTVAASSNLPSVKPMHALAGQTKHPDIPMLAWSVVQGHLPSAQRALVADIYLSWQLGRGMDKRDQVSLASREKNSDQPGTLRSWHVNEQRQLPDIKGAPLPAKAAGLDTHYAKTSRHPHHLSVYPPHSGGKGRTLRIRRAMCRKPLVKYDIFERAIFLG